MLLFQKTQIKLLALLVVCLFLLQALIGKLGYFHCSVWLVCTFGCGFDVIQSKCALLN